MSTLREKKDAAFGLLAAEQELLWYDLNRALDAASPRPWSIDVGSLCLRIGRMAALVGPTPWEKVPVDLVASGVYDTLLRQAGVTPARRTDDQNEHVDDVLFRRGPAKRLLSAGDTLREIGRLRF